ncbi:E3 ubiquitin protein ligase DRIP2 isoform X2 [Amborella trichopoda]|uniref:E3 ubiquitin protein ligase DRIP2 isoform X2 n=1 Tax=Amborella trichopoda TaxID=13333 RepID=UPI0005D38DE0|nr:E3 ubiquitin protein ligase DRIP2 isoform X2 [Amborella trichopoda]|eukprot:XP_011621599.1 E3 ubiquitin protein ligase DRIP2 isoform X2 [Amborella trichopoda]
MTTQVVRVRRATLEACMTCPLCKKLLRDATTISECLHTFCRKCIYEKLTDGEADSCPICNIDLGCAPVEKLRPDHNLQDVRAKIFPLKRRKVKAPEVPPIPLPVRRKERSLSSLVISTPCVSTQTGLTGRRTKAAARKAASLRGSNTPASDEAIKREGDIAEDQSEKSSSPEPLKKNKKQNASSGEPSNHACNNDTANVGDQKLGKAGLWKPLNCLVEAANRTKSLESNTAASAIKVEDPGSPASEEPARKPKVRGYNHKSKIKEEEKNTGPTQSGPGKGRKANGVARKRASGSKEKGNKDQTLFTAACVRWDRRTDPIWFSLVASENQEGDSPLPQISTSYLRIKDGNIPASFIKKYLVKKLDLKNESEVELTCRGQPVVPSLALHSLVDLWLRSGGGQLRAPPSPGASAKDFMMVLVYSRKS